MKKVYLIVMVFLFFVLVCGCVKKRIQVGDELDNPVASKYRSVKVVEKLCIAGSEYAYIAVDLHVYIVPVFEDQSYGIRGAKACDKK